MVIDVAKWRENKVENQLISLQNKLSDVIEFWDQDVLNSYFDGNYVELPDSHNFFIDLALNNGPTSVPNNIVSVHYIGKTKPWSVKGILQSDSEFFQIAYRLISRNNFYITHSVRRNSLLILVKSIFSLKIFTVKKPLSFFLNALRSMK